MRTLDTGDGTHYFLYHVYESWYLGADKTHVPIGFAPASVVLVISTSHSAGIDFRRQNLTCVDVRF